MTALLKGFYDLAGRDDFNKAISDYYLKYKDTGATLNDFTESCKQIKHFDTDKFFKDWIYSTDGIRMIVSGKTYNEMLDLYRIQLR